MEAYMRGREVQAVVEAYVPDIGLYGKGVQVAPAIEANVVECDVFIPKGGEVDIQAMERDAGLGHQSTSVGVVSLTQQKDHKMESADAAGSS